MLVISDVHGNQPNQLNLKETAVVPESIISKFSNLQQSTEGTVYFLCKSSLPYPTPPLWKFQYSLILSFTFFGL